MMNLTSRWHAAARLVAAALATALLISCGQDSPQQLMASAKDYLAKGDRSAAVIQLKNLLSKTPDNGEARLLLGEALLEEEDYVSAEKELGRALELKQPQERVLPAYVRSMLAQGKNQAVVTEVEKHKLFNPQAVAATQTLLGDAQTQLGNRPRARDAYAAAVAAVPGYPRARLGEARLAAVEGRMDEALKQIDEVIAGEPKLAEAKALRADILLAKGDRKGARKALEEAIAANERYLPARLTLISLLTDEREFDAAAKLIESTRKVAPGELRVAYSEAVLEFRRGNMGKAREQVQQVLKYAPEYVPALVLAGAVDLQDRQFTAAEAHLRKAVARAPGHLGARQLLVQTYLQGGQPVRAKDALQPLIERGMPDDARSLLLAGETYLANSDVQRATRFFQAAAVARASTGGAREVVARTRLGQIALATGRSEEGFRELEAAAEQDAGGYQADLAIIAGHLRRNELDKALKALEALEKKQPKNPLTYQTYGLVYLAKNDVAAARRSFEKALELQPNYLPAASSLARLDAADKRPDVARKRYEAMIAKDPTNEQLYIALAELQLNTGSKLEDVAVTLLRAITANPQSSAARTALIEFHLRAGDPKAAVNAAQNAVAAMPNDAAVLNAAGSAQEAAGQINQAIETFNKLAALQPQNPEPLTRLAGFYARQKEIDKAVETLRRVQKLLAPRDRDVVPLLVQVLVAGNRGDEALSEARALQKREPDVSMGFALEGDVHFAQRRYGDAERLYREALRRDPDNEVLAVKLHGTLAVGGKSADAEAWSRKWLAEHPKDVGMRMHLAGRDLGAKNLKAAAAHYRTVVDLQPNNAVALNDLAWIAGELGDPKALGYAERAVKLAPNNAAFLDTYGMLLVNKGEAERGLPFLERARKLAPAHSELRLNYAKALIKLGRKDEARKELEALQGSKENFRGKDQVAGLLKGL